MRELRWERGYRWQGYYDDGERVGVVELPRPSPQNRKQRRLYRARLEGTDGKVAEGFKQIGAAKRWVEREHAARREAIDDAGGSRPTPGSEPNGG